MPRTDRPTTGIEVEWRAFDEHLVARLGRPQTSRARGASNGPFVLDNGFRFGLFNIDLSLDKIDRMVTSGRPLALITGVVLPPRHVLNLALVFRAEALERVGDRLEEIRQELASSGKRAGQPKGKANKVRVYLHPSGIYLRQDTDMNHIAPSADGMGAPLWATECWYADLGSGPDLPPVAMTWLGFIGGLLSAMPRSAGLHRLTAAITESSQ